jgi:nicotinate-nucleotide adenylyltransferase
MASLSVKRVGLFGGSFNPPHLAHQMVCLYALATGEVDEVWMMPTFRHAFGKSLAPFDERVAMCRLAVSPLANVRVDPLEGEIGAEHSRTWDTLLVLASRHPDTQFRLVIGSDILAETSSWHRWDDVVKAAPPIVVPRAGAEEPGHTRSLVIPAISSTDIRKTLESGQRAEPLVPRAVMDYIAGRGLYA